MHVRRTCRFLAFTAGFCTAPAGAAAAAASLACIHQHADGPAHADLVREGMRNLCRELIMIQVDIRMASVHRHMHMRGLRLALLPARTPQMDQAQLALATMQALVPWAMPGSINTEKVLWSTCKNAPPGLSLRALPHYSTAAHQCVAGNQARGTTRGADSHCLLHTFDCACSSF